MLIDLDHTDLLEVSHASDCVDLDTLWRLTEPATNDFSTIIESERRPAPLKEAFDVERVGDCTIYRPVAWRR
jgi:hypothetical protein